MGFLGGFWIKKGYLSCFIDAKPSFYIYIYMVFSYISYIKNGFSDPFLKVVVIHKASP